MARTQTVHDTNTSFWFLILHFFSLDTVTKQSTIKHIKNWKRISVFRCPSHFSNASTWLLPQESCISATKFQVSINVFANCCQLYQDWPAFVVTLCSSSAKHNIVFLFLKHLGVTGISRLSFQQQHNLHTWRWFCSAALGIMRTVSNLESQKWQGPLECTYSKTN